MHKLHCWLTNRKNIPTAINRAPRIPTINEATQCRRSRGFDPAPFWAAPMPSQKGRLLIASSQANSQVAEGYGSRWLVSTAARGRHSPAHGSVLCSTSGQPVWLPLGGLAVRAPGRAHKERPRCRTATGNKKCVAFPEGALTDFGFQKRGVGVVRAPACATARSRAVAQR